ncbi:hypothetical protein [Alicyclobacillus dauci]|uniref:Uncharacterized protein n=1 Tax=Alicyclobacillus dauci TaxID=1475485 RepID=A0ABY6YYB6_9BACL|nr:hypothetical protein [Alicyclobacillus dauci]WAH35567.1 hypothetical protein NZD86_14890 [Alicyclobacillus dauci]
MGVFGGYTRWAVVFLIIFVLFFLLCPSYGYAYGYGGAPLTAGTITASHYDATVTAGYATGGLGGGYDHHYGAVDYIDSDPSDL